MSVTNDNLSFILPHFLDVWIENTPFIQRYNPCISFHSPMNWNAPNQHCISSHCFTGRDLKHRLWWYHNVLCKYCFCEENSNRNARDTHTHTHRAHDYCMGLTKYILQQMTTQFRLPTRYLLSHSDEAKQETWK